MNKEQILNSITIDNPFNLEKAMGIYLYGSRVYGTYDADSDYDVVVVSDIEEPVVQFKWFKLNCTVYSIDEFEKTLQAHEIGALECIFLPDEFKYKHYYDGFIRFELDTYKLRHSISAKASNSFVKAKKKFTIVEDKDIYVGKKSLFHSLRIPIFGKQIAEHRRIVDYTAANHYWPTIRDCTIEDWEYYKKKYQPVHNNLMSEFRKAAPKV
jgi:predicted nucleotidyltransferase